MFPVNPEIPLRYSINTLENPEVLRKVAYSYGEEGARVMHERSATSSVPPFLGRLIEAVRAEVTPLIPLRRNSILAKTDAGLAATGGSSLCPTIEEEVAYRIYGGTIKTPWIASYVLWYSAGVAFAKMYPELYEKHQSCFPTDLTKFNQEFYKLDRMVNQVYMSVQYYGGLTLLMEDFAKGPQGLLKGVRHFATRLMHGYPSVDMLGEARDIVDHYFDDRYKYNKVFMEAQRLKALQLPSV